MIFVFFVYGLSFFVLGLSILIYPKKGSMFNLAKQLNLVAGFGLVHGINEWLDMFIEIGKAGVIPLDKLYWVPILVDVRMVLLPVSFLFLLMFGIKVVCWDKNKCPCFKILPLLLPIAWLVIFIFGGDRYLMGDICSRYLLCVPGTVLTAYGLFLLLPQFEKTEQPVIIRHLKLAGVVFFIYGILAGAIVRKADFFPASVLNYDLILGTFGVPVQIFRAACAAILAYSTLRVLRVFRWETQNALRQSELRFRSIAASVPIILFMEDRDGIITFLEGKGLDAINVKSDELIGKDISSLFPGISRVKAESSDLKPGQTHISVFSHDEMTFELCYSPVQDTAGSVAGFIGVALDITRRTAAQEELERNRREMTRTKHLTELGTISTAMTAQIERPLKITQLLLERLLKDIGGSASPEQVAKTLEKSFTEVSEAVSVLTRFTDFAGVSPVGQIKPVDLHRFVERVMAVCAQSAAKVNLDIATEGLDVVPCMSMAETELEYVFLVLIQTAIEASDSQRKEGLSISCEMSDKHIRLAFADTCRAIPSDQLKNVFRPFFNAQPDGKESEFSLAIVSHIVNSAGGAITVDSVEEVEPRSI